MSRKLFDAFRATLAQDQEKASPSPSPVDKGVAQKDKARHEKKPAEATSSKPSLKPSRPTRRRRYSFAPL